MRIVVCYATAFRVCKVFRRFVVTGPRGKTEATAGTFMEGIAFLGLGVAFTIKPLPADVRPNALRHQGN